MIIECQRQALCNIPEFAPYSGFCRIDRTAQESIRPQDVLAFMKDNGCNVKLSDCARLVNFFDSDEDGILSYQDFIQIVLPCDDNMLRASVQRRPYSRVGRFDSLPYDQESGLARLLNHEIDLIKRITMFVEDLKHNPDYTPYAAFRTIDRYQEGHIKIANLQDFFRQFGNYLVETEIFAIIRRIDTDGDAQLSFEEF